MKLSKDTLAILKNFASINGNIKVEPGNKLKTISAARNVLAVAEVAETFSKEFCIYDLGGFLNSVTLFDDADLQFGDDSVLITAGNTVTKWRYSPPAIIVAPEKDPKIDTDPNVKFSITADDLAKLNRGASAVNGDTIKITTKGNKVVLEALDDRTTVNVFKMTLTTKEELKEGEYCLKRQNMNFIVGDYDVAIWDMGISQFTGNENAVQYFVSLEK